MKTTQRLFAMTIACALLAPAALLAQINPHVPTTMFYEGYLEEGDVPVDGTRSMIFSIYDAATVGATLFTESHGSVQVTEGWFTVELGLTDDLMPLALNEESWLEVMVGGNPMDRAPLHSVPYALRAGAVEWDNVIGNWDIAVGTLTADTVTATDLVATDLTLTNPPTITSQTEKTLIWSAGPNALWKEVGANETTAQPCFALINGRGACKISASQLIQVEIHVFLDGVPDNITITEWGMHTGGSTSSNPDTWTCELSFADTVVDTLIFAFTNTNQYVRMERNTGLSIAVDNSQATTSALSTDDNSWKVRCFSDNDATGVHHLKYIWIKYTE